MHATLGTLILACSLWSSIFSPHTNLEAPISLELQALKPSQRTAIRSSKQMVAPMSSAHPSEPTSSAIPSSNSTVAQNSEEAIGSTKTSYLSELRNYIERHKSYPPQARTLGHEGQAEIKFSILSDGSLSSVELLRSSGSSILDQAALSLLQRVQKLSPIPSELRMTRLDLVLPIQYSLN
ncbi:MAG: energy transducer TonB [Bdellovibrionales bacterium]|nr:energy transducer TonB [Bdellovibrionales bacterium]